MKTVLSTAIPLEFPAAFPPVPDIVILPFAVFITEPLDICAPHWFPVDVALKVASPVMLIVPLPLVVMSEAAINNALSEPPLAPPEATVADKVMFPPPALITALDKVVPCKSIK